MNNVESCPCGGVSYAECCEPFITGLRIPDTAGQLMRSRYVAYTRNDELYLTQTWHVSTRPAQLALASQPVVRWIGLQIIRTVGGGIDDTDGVVEFIARYKTGGKAQRLHETSRFVREGGRWYYVDGDMACG